MEINVRNHKIADREVAEITSSVICIATAADGLSLLGDLYYQGYQGIILYEENISKDFFNLKSGMAGELLQKFSNFRMRLVIVGDWRLYAQGSMHDFINESNRGTQVNFVDSLAGAISAFSVR
jgi:GTPase SAR1 family protein